MIQTKHENMINFIIESKKEVEAESKLLIDSIKKWQQKSNERFDMIHQKYVQEHNLENALANDERHQIEHQTIPSVISTKPKNKCSSMPGKFNVILVTLQL